MQSKYGYFNEDGSEFIITNPKTPRAFDNFMWNDSLFSVVHQTGVGFFDYQYGDTEAIKLLTGIGRICDFDVFGREGLMSRLVYIRNNDTGEFWNLNWEPVKKLYDSYQCVHGLGYTHIKTSVNGLEAGFRIFVPKGKDPVELWTLDFKNNNDNPLNLSIFVYNQFIFKYKWGFNSYGDMLYRNSYFNKELNALISTKHPHIKPHNYLTGFMLSDLEIVAYDGSRDFFMGTYNGYNEPEAVIRGRCSNSEGSSDSTIGAVQYDFRLKQDEIISVNIILGATDSEEGVSRLKEKYLYKIEDYFTELKTSNKKFIEKNKITTPDAHFNRMLNIWIKHQTAYGAKWCRWGWMGYRDIVQHGYGVSSFDPTRTKEILLEAFKYQNSNGMALRGWNPVDTKPYSDSALWLVFTLISYLKETDEIDLLYHEIPYFDKENGTVLDHIERALGFLETNKGSHKLCLIKFGDWNDSLTGVGKEGRGESIWLSMAYAEALNQMEDLFIHLDLKEKVLEYSTRFQAIKNAINENAWDGKWYIRCYDDNGRPIGSNQNEQGKIHLNAQSWSLIAGIADEYRAKQAIQSADEHLLTEMGYKILSPTYLKRDDHIGRISYLEPGICENGTVYSHVNAWMILGLLRAKQPDKAFEIFKLITPGYVSDEKSPKNKVVPYIYANGYFGPDHRNNKFQMEFTWITGSVAWHYNNLAKEMIGIKPDYNGLRIEPNFPLQWNLIEAMRSFRGKEFKITIQRTIINEQLIILNGAKYEGNLILLKDCLSENKVEVFIPL